jgi:hypothetical protein
MIIDISDEPSEMGRTTKAKAGEGHIQVAIDADT